MEYPLIIRDENPYQNELIKHMSLTVVLWMVLKVNS